MNEVPPTDLLSAAADAAAMAHCPYSGFAVGAALATADGRVFRGCNVENASYGLTLCAERNAIVAAVAEGQRVFRAIAIVTLQPALPYPCGACRQVLSEFCGPDLKMYIAHAGALGAYETRTLGALLPDAFKIKEPPV